MNTGINPLFENLPEILSPDAAAKVLSCARSTVYDWRARPVKYGVPTDLFIKFGRKIYVRRDVLKAWVVSRQ